MGINVVSADSAAAQFRMQLCLPSSTTPAAIWGTGIKCSRHSACWLADRHVAAVERHHHRQRRGHAEAPHEAGAAMLPMFWVVSAVNVSVLQLRTA